jgi:hypothetical protein
MTRSLGVVLVTVVVATAAAACGGAGDEASRTVATAARTQPAAPPPPASDLARAKDALVRIADMPHGWEQQNGNVTRIRCGSFEPFAGASALVRSRRLARDHAGVQERIALFRSEAAARRALRRLDSRTAAGCLRRELRRHVTEEANGPAGPAELVRGERLGPASHAWRYVSTAVSNYGKVVGYIDAVHARVGRSIAALVIVSGPAPPDEALYDRVVALVTRRLTKTLA